ncbi:MAG: YhdP family protein, partial [bacterium]
MSVWKFTATASRWLWTIVAFLIIAFAILVVLGRFAIQSLPEYQQKIADEISAQIGYPIEFKELSGDWYGFSPKIYLREISLYSSAKDEAPALSAQSLTAEPDLLGSLRHGTLVWKQLVLSGLKLRITEELDGSWSLNGIKGMSGGSGGLETVSDFLFASRLLELESLSAEVQFVSGVESGFRLHDVQIENAAGFHRVQANVRSAGEEEMATLLIEGWGDPLNWREFKGGYYLELNRIDNTGLLAAAFQNWLPATFDKVGEVETDINTQIWIGFDGSGRGVISGHIEAAEIPLNWIRDVPPIVNYHAMIGGEYVLGSHWQVGLH